MKYKVGDRVRIKGLDWYNENKDEDGIVELSTHVFIPEMVEHCGTIVTIKDVFEDIDDNVVYYMEEVDFDWTDEMIESLVERNGKTYPYKIGDRVILKGSNRCATITDLKYNSWGNLLYYIKIDNDKDISIDYPTDLLLPYDNMIEELVEKESENYSKVIDNGASNPIITKTSSATIDTDKGFYSYSDSDDTLEMEWNLPQGYQFKDENGNVINAQKIVLEKKKKEYPKTFEECCKVLGIDEYDLVQDYRVGKIRNIQSERIERLNILNKLLICRDAYWKLYGEEMGLGKPWEPDWTDLNQLKHCIWVDFGEFATTTNVRGQHILAFPTAEMRDAFYENFKKEIEICKELL